MFLALSEPLSIDNICSKHHNQFIIITVLEYFLFIIVLLILTLGFTFRRLSLFTFLLILLEKINFFVVLNS